MPTETPTIGFVSLGCPKATVDSEQILSRLRAEGYQLSNDYFDSDLVVINTCGFIESAIEESLDAIGEALRENGRVIVTGCLGASADKITDAFPEVLAVTGPHAYDAVLHAVHQHLPPAQGDFERLVPKQGLRLTPRHYAYLKISEGCNHHCSFCIIPDLRGPLQSRPIGEILQEAEALTEAGCRELLVVAQDTGAYGLDSRYRTGFWQGRPIKSRLLELAQQLGQLGPWVRLHYLYPYPAIDQLLPLMAEGRVLPYLDIPLQHASPSVLKAMQRPANEEDMLARIAQWRRDCPDITLRSTFIVGFPGETEADFEHLLDFLREARLDRVGAFTYSPVEGAGANALPGAVPEELKIERIERLMALQAEISAERLARQVGRTLQVLVDGHDEGTALARGPGDAPEVDGLVLIEQGEQLPVGEFAQVEIIDSDVHDLWARPL